MLYEATKGPGTELAHCIPDMLYEATNGFLITVSVFSLSFFHHHHHRIIEYEDCMFLL